MAEYEESREMPAPREQVFEVASDVDGMSAWLPGLEVREAGPNRANVRPGSQRPGQPEEVEALWRAEEDQMRLEWGDRGRDEYSGWMQLYARDGGRSEANLHLSFRGDHPLAHHGRADEEVPRIMRESLDRLAEAVARRVRPGG